MSATRGVKNQENQQIYEGWNLNSGNYLFTTETK